MATTRRSPSEQSPQGPMDLFEALSNLNALNTNGESMEQFVGSLANSLFGVGLDLSSARSLADGEAALRIDKAVKDLDAIIITMRSAIVTSAPSRHQSPNVFPESAG